MKLADLLTRGWWNADVLELEDTDELPDARTFLVVAYWPDRKNTYTRDLTAVADTLRCAFATGATAVHVEPEWNWRAA